MSETNFEHAEFDFTLTEYIRYENDLEEVKFPNSCKSLFMI